MSDSVTAKTSGAGETPTAGRSGDGSTPRPRPWWDDPETLGWATFGGMALLVFVAYANVFWQLAFGAWAEAGHSHGWLIMPMAAAIIYMRREDFHRPQAWEMWLGLGIVTAALVCRIFAARLQFYTLDKWSLIPALMGCFVMAGGWRTLRWTAPGLLFLVFMFPLPQNAQDRFLHSLQQLNSVTSTYCLQTLGVPCTLEGTQITLVGGKPLNVAEACSGLRTATVCLAMGVALALITTWRPWWERVVLVLSTIPIAIFVNTVRITLTGLLMYKFERSLPEATNIFHDLPGLLMIGLALGTMFLVMKVLSLLVITEPIEQPSAVGLKIPASDAKPE